MIDCATKLYIDELRVLCDTVHFTFSDLFLGEKDPCYNSAIS